MPFPKPEAMMLVPELDATRVRFDDGTVGEYYVRGGIAWPTAVLLGDRSMVKGYAVMCGVNIRTGRCNVFSATEFNAISQEVTERSQGQKARTAVQPWFNRCLTEWGTTTYYWHDRGETHHQFRLQIARDEMLFRKPILVRIEWDDDGAAEQVFWAATTAGNLAMEEGVARAVSEAPMGSWCPARHALICALVGLQRRPWHRPDERRESDIETDSGTYSWKPI